MATRKAKPVAKPGTRPFYEAHIKDALEVHRAIAEGDLPLYVAPIDLSAAARWAHENISPGRPEVSTVHGLEVRRKP